MKTLPGYEIAPSDYAELQEAVDRLLWELVYAPVVELVRPELPKVLRARVAPAALREATPRELHNAGDAFFRRALQTGAVQLVPDHTGESAVFAVSKPDRRITDALKSFGARRNKVTGLWDAPRSAVPAWVYAEAMGYGMRMELAHKAVDNLTRELDTRVDAMIDAANLSKAADHAISEIGANAWKRDAKRLEVKWDFGPQGQGALADAYMRTRNVPIKSPGSKVSVVSTFELVTKSEVKVWAHEALSRLREEVAANAEQGYRAENLAERIRNEYGVSKNRAELIASQETRSFMAAYRRGRAADAGMDRYIWTCVMDSRTRKAHHDLHNRVFRYDRPPITDTRTLARNNPGEDFRCRCIDRPILTEGTGTHLKWVAPESLAWGPSEPRNRTLNRDS